MLSWAASASSFGNSVQGAAGAGGSKGCCSPRWSITSLVSGWRAAIWPTWSSRPQHSRLTGKEWRAAAGSTRAQPRAGAAGDPPPDIMIRTADAQPETAAVSHELHHILHADDMPADHFDHRQHPLQVLAGAHRVAEAALERRLLRDRRGAGGAIAGDRDVGRLVHADGGGEPQAHAQIHVQRAGGRRVIDLARRLVQERARGPELRLQEAD